ncbi:MAG: hypothetical protein ACK5NK_00800 [Niabella sp.]
MQKIDKNFINQLQELLGMIYVEDADGNVCQANNNAELKDDYKQVFTYQDVINYINATTSANIDIPLPRNAKEFWEKASLKKNS